MKKFNLKSKKSLVFILLLLLLVGIGTTFAYYYGEVIIPNQFQAMTYNVTVEEEFYDDWGTKKVSFVNKEATNTPVVLRVNYNEVWTRTLTDGTKIILNNLVNGENPAVKNWTDTFTNDFVLKEDGWYYYTKTLDSQQSVQILESVTKNTSLDLSDYDKAEYELSFNFEAIQATSNAVKEIWGYDITIEGSNVTW